MRFIGDIHADLDAYRRIIAETSESVQVGDFGIGFISSLGDVDTMHSCGNHKFIRGNHDDPGLCKTSCPGYIHDGHFDKERSIMYIGGAWSIDYKFRTPGYTWWPDEELSSAELDEMYVAYMQHKPKIMVTHDCPHNVAYELFLKGTSKPQLPTRTASAFQEMLEGHKPDLWVFGHWHINADKVIDGTRFVCLGINQFMDI